ncbi:MAG: aldolase/citrate lyase family protein, partial [Chthoniobacterales bacterium]
MIYQFIPNAPARVMERLIRSMAPGTTAILDLEDGYLDVRDPNRTSERRAGGRRALLELCERPQGRTHEKPVVMRVNGASTEDFVRDIPVVRAVAETFGLAAVMLPKVESAEDLRSAHAELDGAGIPAGSLIPMVETEKGMSLLDEVLRAAVDVGASALVYGHHDYSLDVGKWPFPSPREQAYWDPVERVAGAAMSAGLRYVHPPEPSLRDEVLLRQMISKLRGICGDHLDLYSAGMSQTAILLRLTVESLPSVETFEPVPRLSSLGPQEKKQLAEETCVLFEEYNRQEHSFSADARTGRFISPHEYLAAVRYLGSLERA